MNQLKAIVRTIEHADENKPVSVTLTLLYMATQVMVDMKWSKTTTDNNLVVGLVSVLE